MWWRPPGVAIERGSTAGDRTAGRRPVPVPGGGTGQGGVAELIAQSQALASLNRLELQIATQVRSAARNVETNFLKVQSNCSGALDGIPSVNFPAPTSFLMKSQTLLSYTAIFSIEMTLTLSPHSF